MFLQGQEKVLGIHLILTPQEDYVVSGFVERSGPVRSFFAAKWSSKAELLWAKELQGMTTAWTWPGALTADGSYYFGGSGYYTHANSGAFVIKVDPDGNKIWAV